jgi:hypothetical protein
MPLIEPLPTPTALTTDFGAVTLTHRAISFTVRPWDRPRISSVQVLGILDAGGQFKPYPGTEQNADWKQPDAAAVFRDGAFTTEEIVTRHDAILART